MAQSGWKSHRISKGLNCCNVDSFSLVSLSVVVMYLMPRALSAVNCFLCCRNGLTLWGARTGCRCFTEMRPLRFVVKGAATQLRS